MVVGGGYQAAVLLDAQGRLLQIAHGEARAARHADREPLTLHRAALLKGKPAVSPVTCTAAGGAPARGAPVVGFATPFDTPQGQRRVLSGAFDIRQSPLTPYLPSVSTDQAEAP